MIKRRRYLDLLIFSDLVEDVRDLNVRADHLKKIKDEPIDED